MVDCACCCKARESPPSLATGRTKVSGLVQRERQRHRVVSRRVQIAVVPPEIAAHAGAPMPNILPLLLVLRSGTCQAALGLLGMTAGHPDAGCTLMPGRRICRGPCRWFISPMRRRGDPADAWLPRAALGSCHIPWQRCAPRSHAVSVSTTSVVEATEHRFSNEVRWREKRIGRGQQRVTRRQRSSLNTSSASLRWTTAPAATSAASSISPGTRGVGRRWYVRPYRGELRGAEQPFGQKGPITRCVVMMCDVASSSSKATARASRVSARSGVSTRRPVTTIKARARCSQRGHRSHRRGRPRRCWPCSTGSIVVISGRQSPLRSPARAPADACAARMSAQVSSSREYPCLAPSRCVCKCDRDAARGERLVERTIVGAGEQLQISWQISGVRSGARSRISTIIIRRASACNSLTRSGARWTRTSARAFTALQSANCI